MPPVRNKIIHNTLYSIIGRFWTVLVGIVLVPYTISHIGIERFGIWALLSILVGYFALLDFGIGVSYTRFIAEAYTRNDHDEVNRIVNSGFVFYFMLSVPIIAIAYFGRTWFFSILNINEAAYPDLVIAYYGVLILFMVSTVLSGFTSILQGVQKIDIVNKIAIVVSIPNAIGTVLFLRAGYKLDGLMWTSALTSVCGLVVSLYYAHRYFPALEFNPSRFNIATVRRLLSFGLKMQFGKLADVISFQADKTFVSFFSGIGAVGYYQVGTQIVWRIRDIPLLLLSSLLPAASEIHALNDRKKLLDIYERGSKYLAVVSIPLIFFLIAVTRVLMLAWMGAGYETSALVTQILGIGYLCNILVGVGVIAAAGMNQPDFQWHSAILTTVLNIILVLLLGYYFGMIGVAIGGSLSLIPGALYFMVKFHKYVNIRILPFLRTTMAYPFFISLFIAGALWAVNVVIFRSFAFHGRLPHLIWLGVEGAVFFPLYGLAIWKSTYFDAVDKELFVNNYLLLKIRRMIGAA